jgi:hypothetical protein
VELLARHSALLEHQERVESVTMAARLPRFKQHAA